MQHEKWSDKLPIVRRNLNNTPSLHRQNIASLTAFTASDTTLLIRMFLRISTGQPITVSNAQAEHLLNLDQIKDEAEETRGRCNARTVDKQSASERQAHARRHIAAETRTVIRLVTAHRIGQMADDKHDGSRRE